MAAQKRWLWLAAGLLSILGCATLPEPPVPSGPYAVLEFPAAIRLLALDDWMVDPRIQHQTLRVNPGRHTLQFAYVAASAGGSRLHDGQHAAPFTLDVQAGVTYRFVAKT